MKILFAFLTSFLLRISAAEAKKFRVNTYVKDVMFKNCAFMKINLKIIFGICCSLLLFFGCKQSESSITGIWALINVEVDTSNANASNAVFALAAMEVLPAQIEITKNSFIVQYKNEEPEVLNYEMEGDSIKLQTGKLPTSFQLKKAGPDQLNLTSGDMNLQLARLERNGK